MAYTQKDSTVYLDPVTSQYYTNEVYTPQRYGGNNFMGNNSGYMGMGGFQQANGGYGSNAMFRSVPTGSPEHNARYKTLMTNLFGTRRNYTGDISMVNKMMQNRQPYQYNAPSIASMFPQMAMPIMNQQYTGGAGQFMGGLLGNSPMLSQGNAPMTAPASSGAGRFA